MTQEEKQLLLKDLCARLPYGVFVKYGNRSTPVKCDFECHPNLDNLENIKPYLRPMESMTEEEKKEYNDYHSHPDNIGDSPWFYVDWLIAHHFDFRGLISKGFALEAKDDMYK